MVKINRIISKPATGIFKDKDIEVEFGKDSSNTYVRINGKILNNVQFVGVKCRAGELPKLVIEKLVDMGKDERRQRLRWK